MNSTCDNALITGITGMVGSHLADFLLKHTDWNIFGMCRWRSPLGNVDHLLQRANKKDRLEFIDGDLCDIMSLQRAVKLSHPKYVFHLAAQSFPTTSFTSPIQTLDVNILGTVRLLESLRHCDGIDPIVHVCASSEIFGRVDKESLPISEDCKFHPASPYAISKAGTDLVGRFYAESYGQKIITSRMFTHTGPRRGDVFAESTFAKQIAMIEADLIPPIVKVGNLNSLRTWSDVRDAVRAYHMLVTVNPISGEFYNIGGTDTRTIGEMLEFLISISKRTSEIEVETDPARIRPLDADAQIPDTRKFCNHTGWRPEIPFEKTMSDLLDYWRRQVKIKGTFLSR